ncbi:hypothetical protein [Aquimarina sp. 2304DJ70-9]|uniref:hypothetical protein n=1 Tax=Aquimarina penaris TaxID=3231044 RepID=UPI003462D7E9
MKYQIPFDEKLYIEQTKLTFPYIFPKEYKKMKESLIISCICFILGLSILIGGSELSTLFFVIGIFAIFDLYFKNEKYTGLKNDYTRNLKSLFKENEVTTTGIFELNDHCLRYSNDYLCNWTNWEDFQKYKIVKSNLLLIQKENYGEVFVIGKSEVGEEDFQNILNFVHEKIK